MNLFKVILLGVIQGITEFLPISSSGHLVLFQSFLKVDYGLTLDIFLHLGTLLAVMVVFWDDILKMITLDEKYRKLTYYVILGSIPAGVIGILFEDLISQWFSSLSIVGFALLLTGIFLWLSDRIVNDHRDITKLRFSDAIVVGFAQALAIVPGISRSGSTIVAGIFKGLDRKLAAKYSFLLSIPVIGGATLLEIKNLTETGLGSITLLELVTGTLAAAIAGYFSIRLLLKLINQERLSVFAYYCWLLGLGIIIFL